MAPAWLERLNQATDYRELQSVFSEIAAAARSTTQSIELAESIDQAIYRIQQEGLRDEEELQALRGEYEAFKQQQAGVFGWLKRHLPFTETRRREVRHSQSVSDQEAEVLADNLIIARAQMLKEQLLPPESRRIGLAPTAWQRRLSDHNALPGLPHYADVVRAIDREMHPSRQFVDALRGDISAFEKARFADREDQRRKEDDVAAARSELAALESEIENKASLRAAAVGRLKEMISEDLSGDADYRKLKERIGNLETAARRAKDGGKLFDDMQSIVKDLSERTDQLERIPGERGKLADSERRLERDENDAVARHRAASDKLLQVSGDYKRAQDRVEQARAALSAAEGVYHAYLAESGQVEVDPNDTSPVTAQFARTKAALQAAEAEFRVAAAPYQAAKADATQAEQSLEAIRRQRADTRNEASKLTDQERQLRDEVAASRRRLQTSLDHARSAVDGYLAALRPLDRRPSLRELDALASTRRFGAAELPSESEGTRGWQAVHELYDRVVKSLKRDRSELEASLAADRERHTTIWTTRTRRLLGDDDLANEVAG